MSFQNLLKQIFLTCLEKTLPKLRKQDFYYCLKKVDIPLGESVQKQRSMFLSRFETKSCFEIVQYIKENPIDIFKIEVKTLLAFDGLETDDITESGICLPVGDFFAKFPILKDRFCNSCDLVLEKGIVKSRNCPQREIQGLYMLIIGKHEKDYIVKLGSYAETQGMFKRICSFGGGCYETGSATNKWFQQFIKKAIESGYKARFLYHDYSQPSINITDLAGNQKTIIPYVVRELESQLFEFYLKSNGNIPPIFGSNYKK